MATFSTRPHWQRRVSAPRRCAPRDERAAGCGDCSGWIGRIEFDPAPVPRSCPVKAIVGKIGHGGNRRCQATAGIGNRAGQTRPQRKRQGKQQRASNGGTSDNGTRNGESAGQATAGTATENREGISATERAGVLALPVRIATDCRCFSANGNYTGMWRTARTQPLP